MLPRMWRTVLEFVFSAVSVMIVSALLPGMKVRGFIDALLFAVVVAFFDALAWHTFLVVFSALFSVFTAGIGVLIINGLIFLAAQKVVRGVEISGCFTASIAAVLVSLVNAGIHRLVH